MILLASPIPSPASTKGHCHVRTTGEHGGGACAVRDSLPDFETALCHPRPHFARFCDPLSEFLKLWHLG